MKKARKVAGKIVQKRSDSRGSVLVKDVSRDYGIRIDANPNEAFSKYLKETGDMTLGTALESLEREYKTV